MPAKKRKVSYRKKITSKNLFGLILLFVFSLLALFISLYTRSVKISRSKATYTPPVSDVPVLELKYFPITSENVLDSSETELSFPLSDIRNKVNEFSSQTVNVLTSASSNVYSNSGPYLNYRILESNEYLTPVPKSTIFNAGAFTPFANHFTMLSNIKNGKDVCYYVDQLGVKEVWIWMYHSDKIVPIESNMSMGLTSRDYWNYQTYGDISNSDRFNDLPICQRTYTVYNYNYGRGVGESVENHTHQIESLMNYMDGAGRFLPSAYAANSLSAYTETQKEQMLFRKFTGVDQNEHVTNQGCGWTHFPPNARYDYDWENTSSVSSNCNTWNLGANGSFLPISCSSWGCSDPNSGVNYKKWWMQRIPGLNNGLYFSGFSIRNWWEIVGDFDKAIADGRSLTNWGADYYQNAELIGNSTLSKSLSTPNFDVGYGRVDPAIPEDNFSARFKRIIVFAPGNYQFKIASDGGYKIYLDDLLKVDVSEASSGSSNPVNIEISRGPHIVRIDYVNRVGKASFKLEYTKASSVACQAGTVDIIGCNQIGSCHGAYRTCGTSGSWGACSILPVPEICGDGFDNNCDGVVDDKCAVTTNLTGQVCTSPWTTTSVGCTCTGSARYCNPYYNDGTVSGQRWTRCFPSPENNCQS